MAAETAAAMLLLEQAQLRPGMRVLEIGAPTGHPAALIAHLVGEHGEVTTANTDPCDRLISTGGVSNVPAAWLPQVGPEGRLVVPLRLTGGVRQKPIEPLPVWFVTHCAAHPPTEAYNATGITTNMSRMSGLLQRHPVDVGDARSTGRHQEHVVHAARARDGGALRREAGPTAGRGRRERADHRARRVVDPDLEGLAA